MIYAYSHIEQDLSWDFVNEFWSHASAHDFCLWNEAENEVEINYFWFIFCQRGLGIGAFDISYS
jgi:hypothetical protein